MTMAVLLVIGIVGIGITMTATTSFAALPAGCTGDPHDRDAPRGNPHDPGDLGNPHDPAGFHHDEVDVCPGS
jgi:hypothetical protein